MGAGYLINMVAIGNFYQQGAFAGKAVKIFALAVLHLAQFFHGVFAVDHHAAVYFKTGLAVYRSYYIGVNFFHSPAHNAVGAGREGFLQHHYVGIFLQQVGWYHPCAFKWRMMLACYYYSRQHFYVVRKYAKRFPAFCGAIARKAPYGANKNE